MHCVDLDLELCTSSCICCCYFFFVQIIITTIRSIKDLRNGVICLFAVFRVRFHYFSANSLT